MTSLEKRLAAGPDHRVPTITLESDANGAPHPEPGTYAKKFAGRYSHRQIEGGIGHNLPQEDPKAFAEAIVDVASLIVLHRAPPTDDSKKDSTMSADCKSGAHGQNPHHGWPRTWRLAQLGRLFGRQAGGPRLGAHRHQPGAPVRRRLVGLLRKCDRAGGPQRKIALPAGVTIDAEVDLNVADSGYFLSARLNVSVPGVERDVAQALVDEAHEICPYSKATRGNIDVAIKLV